MSELRPNTVLVLGAGASAHYGFPLGRGLRNRVCKVCSSPTPSLCEITGISETEYQAFGRRVATSGYSSVDWYLEVNTEDMPIGRAAIAAALTGFEEPNELFPGPDAHWYEVVLNRWWSEETNSLALGSQVTILTFNYDRSFEFYLTTVVARRTRQELSAAVRNDGGADQMVIADGPTLVHLHGQLRGDYSNTWSPERLDAGGLLLLSSADDTSAEFERGRAAIAQCERLYFLGFGFHPRSVGRLGDFSDLDAVKGKEISGTHAGLTPREWDEVKSTLFPHGWDERARGNVYQFVRENQI